MSLLRALLAAITALAEAYAQKLRNDAPLARYRAQVYVARDLEALADEIARLRAAGSPADHQRADVLRERLLARQGIAGDLSTPHPPA